MSPDFARKNSAAKYSNFLCFITNVKSILEWKKNDRHRYNIGWNNLHKCNLCKWAQARV